MEKIGAFHIILCPGGGVWSVIRSLAIWQIARFPTAIGVSLRKDNPKQVLKDLKELEALGINIFTFSLPVEFPNASGVLLPPIEKWLRVLQAQDHSINWITHFHNGPAAGFFFWPSVSSTYRYSGPALCTFHGIPPEDVIPELQSRFGWIQTRFNGFLVRQMERRGVRLTTLSNNSAHTISSVYRVPIGSLAVIPNGVNASPRRGCPKINKPGQDFFTVGFVGYLSRGKRWDVVIDAVLQLNREGKNVRCLITGDGPDSDLIKEEASKYPQIVQYLGSVPMAGQKIMPELDLLVLASLQEGQPMVILEAMASGVPVVATKVGAIPETILAGVNGFLLDQPSSNQIAQFIRLLIGDPALHRLMSENCLAQWREKFSDGVMGAKYDVQYREVLADSKQKHLHPNNTN